MPACRSSRLPAATFIQRRSTKPAASLTRRVTVGPATGATTASEGALAPLLQHNLTVGHTLEVSRLLKSTAALCVPPCAPAGGTPRSTALYFGGPLGSLCIAPKAAVGLPRSASRAFDFQISLRPAAAAEQRHELENLN